MTKTLPDLPLLLADVPATLRAALAQEGVPFAAWRSGRQGRFVLFDSRASRPALGSGQVAVDVNVLRSTRRRDPLAALADERSARQEWSIGGLVVRESVGRVDRAAARRRLMCDLRTQIEAAGGLWCRVAPFPRPYQTAFNLRLDHDDYQADDFRATLAAVAGHEHAVSHYVCASTHAPHPEALARLAGAHVGSHGWWHHTYRDRDENLANIRRGIDALRAAGIDPVGFAAPHGRFNAGLLRALEELHVTHSSEFGLAYDDLPFFPRGSAVLQIPVHPICLGICLEAACLTHGRSRVGIAHHEGKSGQRSPSGVDGTLAAQTMLEHWRAIAAQKHAAGEPIFLYGHPDGRLGRYPWLLRTLLAEIGVLPGVWRTSLAAFERWWRERAAIEVTAWRRSGSIFITANHLPAEHRPKLEFFRGGQVAEIELDRGSLTFDIGALVWRRRARARQMRNAPTVASEGWRAGLRRYLDWERVTPIEEISAHSWRGWAKRTLRRMRA